MHIGRAVKIFFLKYLAKYKRLTKLSMVILLVVFNNICKTHYPELSRANMGFLFNHQFLLDIYDQLLDYYRVLVDRNVD